VNRLAGIVFGLLVLATLGAFVIAQKLKSSPPVVVRPLYSSVFSPAPDASKPKRARISFWIARGDDITVSVVDEDGRTVRTIVDDERLPTRVRRTWWWGGRTSDGRIAPDGSYRVRVALIHQGRTFDLPDVVIRLDTTPPRPRVTAVEPEGDSGPAFLPQRGVDGVTVSFRGTEGRRAALRVWRTDVRPARMVREIEIPGRTEQVSWDGTVEGEPAPAGTYLMGLYVEDRAGNPATFPARTPPRGDVPGRAGVTIRRLAAAPPLTPVTAGRRAVVFVDARGRRYTWALRRWGDPKVLRRGRDHAVRLRVPIPLGQSGLHVLTIAADGHRTRVPVVVRTRRDRRVLVVLPALTWQGENPVDDDGDGMPNVLGAGGGKATARLARPFAHGMPASIARREGQLLRFLDADLKRYDLTTDVGLATARGPTLDGHSGVVLAGDERWITPELRRLLRGYVERGGRVWSLGTDSLRRQVRLRDGVLSHPSAPVPTDALGGRPQQPLVTNADGAPMVVYQEGEVDLFAGTGGQFPGYDEYEVLASLTPGAELSDAAGPEAQAGTAVIASWRLDDGVAIHTGLPQFAQRAADGDLDAQTLARRIWAIASR
jgi:N,N-dimethylformamidase beta subunit-like protein